MAVAEAPATTAAEECGHRAPIIGVMAHEFAHYDGALGPEGTRRTVTYYGPIIGGLAISAWHCEDCGLLRLSFPDGRKEERRLFPGPQPGLLAEPSVVAPEAVEFGRQARVSGLSAPEQLYEHLYAEEVGDGAMVLRLPQIELPSLDLLGWTNVTVLALLVFGMFVAAIIAVAGDALPGSEAPLVATLVIIFGVLVLLNAAAPLWRQVFPMPPLSPGPAITQRGAPQLDAYDRGAIWLFSIAAIGLLLCAIFATYAESTSSAEWPTLIATLLFAVGGVACLIGGALSRRH